MTDSTQINDDGPIRQNGIWVVYDGECPFCNAYVRMLRLRKATGDVRLIDARSDHPIVAELKAKGLDLDEGMALKIGDEVYHGDACMHRLALLSGPSDLANRLHYWIFSKPTWARALYPWLRAGRNAALRLLGKRRINERKG